MFLNNIYEVIFIAAHFICNRIIITNSLTMEEHQMTKYCAMELKRRYQIEL